MSYTPTTLIGVVTGLFVLACISVSLRCYVRARIVHSFGYDDRFMLLALFFYATFSAVLYAEVHHGLGGDHEKLSAGQVATLYDIIVVSRCLYFVTTAVLKLSIGLLLLRICDGRRVYRALVIGCVITVAVAALLCFITALLQCAPAGPIKNGKCLSGIQVLDVWYMFSSVNLAVDWFFALLPIPLLWGVQLPTRVKLSLIVVLGMGILASASRAIVLVSLVRSATAKDKLAAYCDIVIWALIESAVAITASSIATLRPLLRCISNAATRRTSHLTTKSGASTITTRSRFEKSKPSVELKPLDQTDLETGNGDAPTLVENSRNVSLEHAYSTHTCMILNSVNEGHYCHGVR